MAEMRLYYSPGACSLAPHIVLEEIGRPFAADRVTLAEKAHLRPGFLAVNPRARVPVLETDGMVLRESGAILVHLADAHPNAALLPPLGSESRAAVLEWLAYITTTVMATVATVFRPERYTDDPAAIEAIRAFGRRRLAAYYAEIEAALPDSGTPWLSSAGYGILDPYLLVLWRWGFRAQIDMTPHIRWRAHTDALGGRPAVQRALATEDIPLHP
jgi:glutathione S-transferase